MAPEPEKPKNSRKRLVYDSDDEDIVTEVEIGGSPEDVEDNVEAEEVEAEEDEENYYLQEERSSQRAPRFVTPAELGDAALEALVGGSGGQVRVDGVVVGDAAGENETDPASSSSQQQSANFISLSQDERFEADNDSDFVITMSQKGKAKLCYNGYR